MIKYLALIACLILSACANPYKDPQGEGLATLRIVNASPFEAAFATYDDGVQCTGIRTIEKRWFKANESLVIKVASDKVMTLKSEGARKSGTPGWAKVCNVTVSFLPKKSKSYAASYFFSESRCSIRISELQDGPNGQVEVPVRGAKKRSTTNEKPFCVLENLSFE